MIAGKRTLSSNDRRREEAARWLVLFQSSEELSARLLKRWKKWESVPENRRTFDDVEQLSRKSREVAPRRWPTAAEVAADRYDGTTTVAEWRAAQDSQPAARRKFRLAATAAGIAATIVAMIGVFIGLSGIELPPWQSMFAGGHVTSWETRVGEHREIALPDGSKIHLGARSMVTTLFTAEARTVDLVHGEALFTVAHDPLRPFRVRAAGRVITAVGTAFNVKWRDTDVTVTVTDGTVEIAPTHIVDKQDDVPAVDSGTRLADVQWLTRGQELTYDVSGLISAPRLTDESLSITWREGRLQYQGEPLRNVIPDVNRYSPRTITLADAHVGELPYTGTVFEGQIYDWLQGLERIYPEVEVLLADSQQVVIRTRPSQAAE